MRVRHRVAVEFEAEARLGRQAEHAHVVMENRNGLAVDASLSLATSTSECRVTRGWGW